MGIGGVETPRKEVDVVVKTVGPGRPTILRVQSPVKVSDLRAVIAIEKDFPPDRLKLILRGQALIGKHGEAGDAIVKLQDKDTIMVAVMPKAPSKYLREGYEEDEDELKFQIPESASLWKKKVFYFLKQKLRMPDILLMAMFSISLKAWIGITIWFLLAPVAHKWDLGPIYILATGFSIILLNLGRRQQGDASAYSIFNEDFRELPGTLNADRLDRDIRAGQF